MPTVNNKTNEDLTSKQLARLWRAIEEDHDIQIKNMLKLCMFTNLRRGEIFNMQWSDIDFNKGVIYLPETKSGRPQEKALTPIVEDILKTHPKTKNSKYVFPGQDGKKRQDARRSANRILKRAGLVGVIRPFHGLRHLYATIGGNLENVNPIILQEDMRHADQKTTSRYIATRRDNLKAYNQKINDSILKSIKEGMETLAPDDQTNVA